MESASVVMNPLEVDALSMEASRARIARDASEPILKPNPNRFVIFPIQHHDLWAMYRKQVAAFWRPEELDLSKDLEHWKKLTENERHFIKRILGFFAGSDGIVMENLDMRFLGEVQLPEARMFYSFQNAMESIHSVTYSLLIDTYIEDADEKLEILRSIQTVPCIQRKADWAMKWIMSKDADFSTRLMAFAVIEGVFFSGAFCSIYWIKQRGVMPGLTTSNEFIARDEGLHTDFACMLFRKCIHRPSLEEATRLIQEAVAIEKEFIIDALPCALLGMSAPRMSEYIEFVADRLMLSLGYSKVWNTPNPFNWMERQGLEGKSNFFEKIVTEYQLADSAGDGSKKEQMKFSLVEDF